MDIAALLGDEASSLLNHTAVFPKERLTLAGPNFVDRVFTYTDRNPNVLRNLAGMYNHGRLGGTGYLSILPVDQDIEHSAAANFAPNPEYYDPAKLFDLAVAAECSAIATTLGMLGLVSRQYVTKIPFIVKVNHNDLLRYPNTFDQRMFASVQQAADLGATGIGATVYFGSDSSVRQLEEVGAAFAEAHRLGMFTVLWCYVRNDAFTKDGVNYEVSADLTSQANHLGVTIEADIIKQKQPTNNGGFNAVKFSKTNPKVYSDLTTDHPIDLTRWQVVNTYNGKIGLINSGGEAKGEDDLREAVRTAVINKRAGGQGLILGRKAFQRPMADGVKILNAVQDVFLDSSVTIA
jgi:class I fructose-bisphosphate aldolase